MGNRWAETSKFSNTKPNGAEIGQGRIPATQGTVGTGSENNKPLFNITSNNLSNPLAAKQAILEGILAFLPPGAKIKPEYEDAAIKLYLDSITKLSHICDMNSCFPGTGAFQSMVLNGLPKEMEPFFNKLRESSASDANRVTGLTNVLTFNNTHSYRGKVTYSDDASAIENVCKVYNVNERELLDLINSEGNFKSIKVVSKENLKAYVIKKGYRAGTLSIYEANGRSTSQEYLDKRLNSITTSSSYLTSIYAFGESKSPKLSITKLNFDKGVTEVSLGAEIISINLAGALSDAASAMMENKYIEWGRPATPVESKSNTMPVGPKLNIPTDFSAITDICFSYCATLNVEKTYDAMAGKGAYNNFMNQTASRVYDSLFQSSQNMLAAGNAFMDSTTGAINDMQARETISGTQKTSEFAYGISKKKKEEKDEQDGRAGGGFT